MPEMNEEVISRNFIENEIDKDLQEGVYDKVVTRFSTGAKWLSAYWTCQIDFVESGIGKRIWRNL